MNNEKRPHPLFVFHYSLLIFNYPLSPFSSFFIINF